MKTGATITTASGNINTTSETAQTNRVANKSLEPQNFTSENCTLSIEDPNGGIAVPRGEVLSNSSGCNTIGGRRGGEKSQGNG